MQWTDPTLSAGATPVKGAHLTELRAGLDTVYDAVGRARPSYTDADLTARRISIRAVHVMELREAVAGLESGWAPNLRDSTERASTDSYRHAFAADVDARANEERNSPKELHDRDDLHEARVPPR